MPGFDRRFAKTLAILMHRLGKATLRRIAYTERRD